MNDCNSKTMLEYVAKMGHKMTDNVFFVEDNLWCELLVDELHITKNPGGTITHKNVQSSQYIAWNYVTGLRREENATNFYTQLKLFKLFKETHEGYMDLLIKELLDKDLTTIAINSEHMF